MRPEELGDVVRSKGGHVVLDKEDQVERSGPGRVHWQGGGVGSCFQQELP